VALAEILRILKIILGFLKKSGPILKTVWEFAQLAADIIIAIKKVVKKRKQPGSGPKGDSDEKGHSKAQGEEEARK